VTTAGFHDVVAAFQTPSTRPDPRTPARVTVLGSGIEGRALAAWFLAEGAEEVRLFTVYAEEMEALSRGSITLRGEGPVGTFRVNGERPSIEVTSVLDTAVADADVIVVSGPVLKQRTYGLVLAQHVKDGQIVMVANASTFGGLELAHWLRAGGATGDVTVVEMTSMPFDIADEAGTIMLTRRRAAPCGVLPQSASSTIERLALHIPDLEARPTILHSSFADGSAVVEVPALLVGGPAVPGAIADTLPGAHPAGGGAFASLLGERHRALISSLAAERRMVAARFGVRDLPEDEEWIEKVAGSTEGPGIRVVPTTSRAIAQVRDGVLGSLVPLMSAAIAAGVEVPVTSSIVAMAESMLGGDLRAAGRSLSQIGFAGLDPDAIRARLSGGAA